MAVSKYEVKEDGTVHFIYLKKTLKMAHHRKFQLVTLGLVLKFYILWEWFIL